MNRGVKSPPLAAIPYFAHSAHRAVLKIPTACCGEVHSDAEVVLPADATTGLSDDCAELFEDALLELEE